MTVSATLSSESSLDLFKRIRQLCHQSILSTSPNQTTAIYKLNMQVSNRTILFAIGVALVVLALSVNQADSCFGAANNNSNQRQTLKALTELHGRIVNDTAKAEVFRMIQDLVSKMN